MPQGKPAGVRCVQLDERNACRIFGHPSRPLVCRQLMPSAEMCGPAPDGGAHALQYLGRLEQATRPLERWRHA